MRATLADMCFSSRTPARLHRAEAPPYTGLSLAGRDLGLRATFGRPRPRPTGNRRALVRLLADDRDISQASRYTATRAAHNYWRAAWKPAGAHTGKVRAVPFHYV